jgi:ubiquinone/menaquinone biosynthesis C-methylase UbiE
MEVTRILVQMHAEDHLKKNDPLGWFETVYVAAQGDELAIPWANLSPNPHLMEWLDKNPTQAGKKALVVGCGLGDDAEELSRRGFWVTAFDISPTAIAWCKKRFPLSQVRYEVQDLLQSPSGWDQFFDFVVEAYTLQSIQSPLREDAIRRLPRFLEPQGKLLVIARGKEPNEFPEGPPWPLTKNDLAPLSQMGLMGDTFEDYLDEELPPIRRFRAAYQA